MKLAPIILFVYNRPWHTVQTLEALSLNYLADKSTLYIYCDGPKENAKPEDLKNIKEVRKIIKEKQWCKEVIVNERNENLGLAESVIQGVTEVIEKHDRAIVLEDDIVTGTYFLKFMNDGLNIYENEPQVFGVSGYRFPASTKINSQTYFLPIMSSWGYGTWQDRWKKINYDGVELLSLIETKGIGNKLDFGNIKYYQMLKDQVLGKNDSWAVRFYVSMLLQKGVFLYPNQSLLKNIGFDGTGVHCSDKPSSYVTDFLKDTNIEMIKKPVVLNTNRVLAFQNHDLEVNKNRIRRLKKSILKLVPPKAKSFIKQKLGIKKDATNPDPFYFLKNIPRYIKTKATLKGHEIDIPDSASFLFMYKEIFEDHIYKFETSNPVPYIIDGGANIGLSSIYLKLLYPKSKIIAFEPDTTIYNYLKKNIDAFNFKGIELINKGLWNKETTLSFKMEGADAGLLTEEGATDTVPVISLKPYLNKKVDFLKLDIEGAETVVLKDIEENLSMVDRIFIKYHSFVGEKQSLNEVINILANAKFRLYISSPGITSKSPFCKVNTYLNMDMQLNIYGSKEK